MPFCPNCRYEYEDNVSTCPDCGEKLVEKLDDVGDSEYKDWVHLARLTSQQFSDMLLEVLRSKEIPAVIISEAGYFGQTGQMGVHSFQAAGSGYSLYVPAQFVVDADREAAVIFGDEWNDMRLVDIEEETD